MSLANSTQIDKFWNIIAQVPQDIKDAEEHEYQRYTDFLSGYMTASFAIQDFVDFENALDELSKNSLIEKVYDNLEQDFVSDDGLDYFGMWLVSRGQEIYNQTLKIGNLSPKLVSQFISLEFETISYVAHKVFALKNPGKDLYDYLK